MRLIRLLLFPTLKPRGGRVTKHDWLDDIETAADEKPSAHWAFDKRIPVALILTLGTFLAGWTGTFIWWMAATSQRLDVMEKAVTVLSGVVTPITQLVSRVDNLERVSATTTATVQPLDSRMTRVETTLGFIQSGVDRIEQSIQRAVNVTANQAPARVVTQIAAPRLPAPVHTVPIPISAPPQRP